MLEPRSARPAPPAQAPSRAGQGLAGRPTCTGALPHAYMHVGPGSRCTRSGCSDAPACCLLQSTATTALQDGCRSSPAMHRAVAGTHTATQHSTRACVLPATAQSHPPPAALHPALAPAQGLRVRHDRSLVTHNSQQATRQARAAATSSSSQQLHSTLHIKLGWSGQVHTTHASRRVLPGMTYRVRHVPRCVRWCTTKHRRHTALTRLAAGPGSSSVDNFMRRTMTRLACTFRMAGVHAGAHAGGSRGCGMHKADMAACMPPAGLHCGSWRCSCWRWQPALIAGCSSVLARSACAAAHTGTSSSTATHPHTSAQSWQGRGCQTSYSAHLAGAMPGTHGFVELCHVSCVLHACGMRTAAGKHPPPLQPFGVPTAFHQTDRALVHVTTGDGTGLLSLLNSLSPAHKR